MSVHSTHDVAVEPGPYPPGEGPLDYANCKHHCRRLNLICSAWWPTRGWVAVDEPANGFDDYSCTACNQAIGHSEEEYEGAYGLRMVLVWRECWAHPSMGDVVLCEDCVCDVEGGHWQ